MSKIDKLLYYLDNHDCHLTEEDGCICSAVYEELLSLGIRADNQTEYPMEETA